MHQGFLLPRDKHSIVGDIAGYGLVFSHFVGVQTDVAVEDVEDAFAYSIHEFPVTVRNVGFTKLRFRRLEYM